MLALLNRYAAVGLVTLLAAPTAAQQHSSDIVAAYPVVLAVKLTLCPGRVGTVLDKATDYSV